MEQLVARQVLQPLAGEASSFSFAGSTLANGMFPQDRQIFGQSHGGSPAGL